MNESPPTTEEPEQMLTLAELARRLKVTTRCVQNWERKVPNFPRRRSIMGAVRFVESEVNEFIKSVGR